jgi:hypothetical protein
MAEIGLVASIVGVLTSTAQAVSLVRGIQRAPLEATQILNQLQTASAILSSLKMTLNTVHRPQEFLLIWDRSTRLALRNISLTIQQLNQQLGGHDRRLIRRIRLSIWTTVTWPLNREEGLILQQQLQGYMQMLAIAQNALLQ